MIAMSPPCKGFKGVSPIIATVILVLITVVLAAMFAAFVLGVFQSVVSQPVLEGRVLRAVRVGGSGEGVLWSVMISLRNSGPSPVSVTSIDLIVDSRVERPLNGFAGFTLSPGESVVVDVVLSNSSAAAAKVSGNVAVFASPDLLGGSWISLRLIDSRGNVWLISFAIP